MAATTVRDILCSEDEWIWEPDHASNILFRHDGTGELQCRVELTLFMAVVFNWKADDQRLEQIIERRAATVVADDSGGSDGEPSPVLLAELDIEITLTTQLPDFLRDSKTSYSNFRNEDKFREEAFEPRKFSVRLEEGEFPPPACAHWGIPGGKTHLYNLRITFDISPYPQRAMWKYPRGGPNANRFWDWTQFVRDNKRAAEIEDFRRQHPHGFSAGLTWTGLGLGFTNVKPLPGPDATLTQPVEQTDSDLVIKDT